MNDKPKTKKDYFSQLDETLSEEDKQAIIKTTDVFEFHFTLGLWIRNHWIYGQGDGEVSALMKAFGEDIIICSADDLSTKIIKEYRMHLRRKRL